MLRLAFLTMALVGLGGCEGSGLDMGMTDAKPAAMADATQAYPDAQCYATARMRSDDATVNGVDAETSARIFGDSYDTCRKFSAFSTAPAK